MNRMRVTFDRLVAGIVPVSGNLPKVRLGRAVLAMALLAGAAANGSIASDEKARATSGGQSQGSYIEADELDAYDAAKKEPDPRKRAVRLMEFLQKYPKSALMDAPDYAEIRAIEEEYHAFHAAGQEPDYDKRAEKLIEFLQKHPGSTLAGNIDYEYSKMLKEVSRDKKYDLAESLGERWLKIHTNDKETYALVAEATMNLKKYQRCAECLEEIYRMEPIPDLAREIHATYQRTENLSKQLEWADKLFKMPEYDSDYMLRYEYVMKFSKSNNLSRAAEYSRLALRSADLVDTRDTQTEEQLRKVRRACYHVIASNQMEQGNYVAAVSAFKQAVKAERYGQGYYKIAICLENQKHVEEALLYYALAETMGEEDAPKAKTRLEVLYKALHNDTLIGIDKVYRKAREMLGAPDKSV